MIKVSETRSAIRRIVLTKVAFSAPSVGGAMVAGGAGAVGAGLGAGVASAAAGGIGAPLVGIGGAVGAPLLAGGAGVVAGDAIRRGADAVTGGGFTRGIQRIGDRAGTAAGSAYQRIVDARSAAKRNDALDSEALNAYNKTWHQFAPEHSFENFQRFRRQYLRNKAIRMATRTREAN